MCKDSYTVIGLLQTAVRDSMVVVKVATYLHPVALQWASGTNEGTWHR